MEWQIRNWLYFTWLSGDHIVEQHVHNIDVANWVMRRTPVRAIGVGGRQRARARLRPHLRSLRVDFEYPNGARVLSMCRQIQGTRGRVGEHFIGTRGTLEPVGPDPGAECLDVRAPEKPVSPYVQEHTNLIASIRAGNPINELKQVAESTLTAIMGREAAYTGQELTWDEMLEAVPPGVRACAPDPGAGGGAMKRRDFVAAGLSGTAAAAAAASGLSASTAGPSVVDARHERGRNNTFKLNYAPHFGMFSASTRATTSIAQLEFMAAEGFTALEDNGMRGRRSRTRSVSAARSQRLNMRMGVFVAHEISWNERDDHDAERDDARNRSSPRSASSVDVARRVNATWMTVVPGHVDRRLDMSYQTANVIETLKRLPPILEPHGLVMVLEPLNTLRNHPGMFLTTSPQAHMICKAVGSPSCKILYDIYHQQITEGNLIPNIDAAWDEIAYFQVGDNPGRNEPGTGEINYRNVFRTSTARASPASSAWSTATRARPRG
jgi:hydroxypyruvate isomerase